MIRLYTDGASRGNPGPAAAGFWAESGDGRRVFERSQRLADCTNNEAEYRALILGLQALLDGGRARDDVEVVADSELLVKQMRGEYRVKSAHLKPLFAEAQRLAQRFSSIRFRSVGRESNRRADALANAAFAGAAAERVADD